MEDDSWDEGTARASPEDDETELEEPHRSWEKTVLKTETEVGSRVEPLEDLEDPPSCSVRGRARCSWSAIGVTEQDAGSRRSSWGSDSPRSSPPRRPGLKISFLERVRILFGKLLLSSRSRSAPPISVHCAGTCAKVQEP